LAVELLEERNAPTPVTVASSGAPAWRGNFSPALPETTRAVQRSHADSGGDAALALVPPTRPLAPEGVTDPHHLTVAPAPTTPAADSPKPAPAPVSFVEVIGLGQRPTDTLTEDPFGLDLTDLLARTKARGGSAGLDAGGTLSHQGGDTLAGGPAAPPSTGALPAVSPLALGQDSGTPPLSAFSPAAPSGGQPAPAPTLTQGPLVQSHSVYPVPLAADPVVRTNLASFGGNPMSTGYSEAGVRYNDGVIQLDVTDLSSGGISSPWGQERSWTNAANYAPGGYGSGWIVSQLPYLLQQNSGSTLLVVTSGTNARPYDLSGGVWVARNFMSETLVANSGAQELDFTDTQGDVIRFNDFSSSRPGLFKSYTDSQGNLTSVTSYTSDNKHVAEVQHSSTVGTTTVTESYQFSYLSAPYPNAGNLSQVVLRRQTNGGSWSTVRQVVYGYYVSTDSHGNLGDLKTATIEDGSGNSLDTDYYRFYTGESGGFVHGLKYVFNYTAYARLLASEGGSFANVQAASDSTVAPYADANYQYDSSQRVTTAVIAGAGSSTASPAGLGTFAYAYTSSGNIAGPNIWAVKTVETLPDGNTWTVYTNAYAEPMLKVYHDSSSGLNWDYFTEYDSTGRILLQAQPSAVTGYNDSYADLLNNQNGLYQYLSNTSGLLTKYDYCASTTATETTAGGVAGYQQDVNLLQGQQGTAVEQSSTQYFLHTAGGISVAPTATATVYRNTGGGGGETTSYAYT
jgi:hypothetical protein